MSKIWKNGETAFSRAIHEIDLKKKARDDKDRKHVLDAQLGRIKTLKKFVEPSCGNCVHEPEYGEQLSPDGKDWCYDCGLSRFSPKQEEGV